MHLTCTCVTFRADNYVKIASIAPAPSGDASITSSTSTPPLYPFTPKVNSSPLPLHAQGRPYHALAEDRAATLRALVDLRLQLELDRVAAAEAVAERDALKARRVPALCRARYIGR